jgi:O-antigen/teichoic acid export membrane protein
MLKRFTFLKYTGLSIGMINSFLQPFLFNKFFDEDTFSFLLVIYGISVYLTFMDGGISKPLYAYLRKKFIKKEELRDELTHITSFYFFVSVILCLLFFTVLVFVWHYYPNRLTFPFLVLFSIYTALNIVITYYYNILSAVEEYYFFEKINVGRRVLNLVAIFLLFIDETFVLSFVLSVVVLVILFLLLNIRLIKKFDLSNKIFQFRIDTFYYVYRRFFKDSKNYLAFSINETLIYNSGFILIPYFLSSFFVVQYGLYVRIYAGIATFMRSVIDITIHDITRFYNNAEHKKLKNRIYLTMVLSVLIVVSGVVSFYFLQELIFTHWVDYKYLFNATIILALALWLFGNSIQHVSGTFLVSIGGHFNMMKRTSFYILLPLVIAQILSLFAGAKFSTFIILSASIYFIGATYYCYVMLKHINHE